MKSIFTLDRDGVRIVIKEDEDDRLFVFVDDTDSDGLCVGVSIDLDEANDLCNALDGYLTEKCGKRI